MAKGKVVLQLTSTNYNDDLKITIKALLKRKLTNGKRESDVVSQKIPLKEQFKDSIIPLSFLSNINKYNEYTVPQTNQKNVLYIETEADFIKSLTKKGDRYYTAIRVNFGDEERPYRVLFFVPDRHIKIAQQQNFKYEHEFELVSNVYEGTENKEDDELEE